MANRAKLLLGNVLARVRVARFKWTGAHVCSEDVRRWSGGLGGREGGEGGRRIAEMDRCLEHESFLCHEEENERGGGDGRARLLYTSD